ncbi:MAG: flavodoxin [Firmicutes bacterium HGW-Firmicutes-1]|jgi:menaquinone-dependent protoporphyrinogen oxidase|nr:MAG: flavodoxin [Firmicutes bacterium HGW-Firmicutes-1]
MKVLIVYATKHGSTEKCAKLLAEGLEGTVVLRNIKKEQVADAESFDKIIVGGSIYAGTIQKQIKEFCSKNEELLKNKKTGYFICGMTEGEKGKNQLDLVFSSELLDKASAKDNFGGEVIFNKMGFLERTIIKKVAKLDKDYSNILENNIKEFAKAMNIA